MSWVDQQQGALAEEPVRRVFYFTTTTSTTTFEVRDQLPQQVVMRVKATAAWASTLTFANVQTTYSKIAELRLYDAFSTERVLNARVTSTTSSTNAGSYLVLGYFIVNASNSTTTTLTSWWFQPAESFETRSMNTGRWTFVLWDPYTNAAYPDSATSALCISVDVRRGGRLIYTS